MQFTGALTPWSNMVLYACAKIDNKYGAVAQRYLYAQSSVFYLIVII